MQPKIRHDEQSKNATMNSTTNKPRTEKIVKENNENNMLIF